MKVRFWTNLSERFWTKVILVYIDNGLNQLLCAKVSVLCFGSGCLLSANFVKWDFEGSETSVFFKEAVFEKESQNNIAFLKTLKHIINRGFARFGVLCVHPDATSQKRVTD